MKRADFPIVQLLIAALVPAAAASMLSPMGGGVTGFLGMGLVLYAYSLAAAMIFGVPLFILFGRLNLIRWWSGALSGLLVGVAVALALRAPNLPVLSDFFFLVPAGIAAGVIFWFLVRRSTDELVA